MEERLSRLEEGRERRTQAPPSPAASPLSKRRKVKRAPVTVSSFGEGGTDVGDPGPSGGSPRGSPAAIRADGPETFRMGGARKGQPMQRGTNRKDKRRGSRQRSALSTTSSPKSCRGSQRPSRR